MRFVTLCSAIAVVTAVAACRQPARPPADESPESSRTAMPSDPYRAEILMFQQEREAVLRADDGWLTIAGLWFLTQPETTFGSDALNDIVLPAGAPARAGTFMMRDGKVSVKAAQGVTFLLDGKTTVAADLRPDGQGEPDRIWLGDLQLWVHNSGDRLSIRLRDRNSPLRKDFSGTTWFPIDPAYRVEGSYVPYETPKIAEVPNILGDIDKMLIPGVVTFSMNGQVFRLEPVIEAGEPEWWFIFRDLTSEKETYPAARFLYAPVAVNGKTTLDFNKARNPPCAYNPYTTCPLPSVQNRLRIRIKAGEMRYKGHL